MNVKHIDASIIQIELQSDKYVQKLFPKYLHGLCYHLAGENYPHEKYLPPMFHPVIAKWRGNGAGGTQATIKIHSLSQELTSNIMQSLEEAHVLRLGHEELGIKRYSIEKQENIPLDVCNAKPVPDEFKINFNTPTKFRTRNSEHYETKAYPELKLLIRSLARHLHILYAVQISLEEQKELINNISLINAIVYPVQAKIDKNYPFDNSFIGELHISCRNLNEKQKKLFGMMLRTAKYSGVGHKKGYGFGHIEITRPLT